MNDNICIWLDDERNPNNPRWKKEYELEDYIVLWFIDPHACINWVHNNGLPAKICFDNDLGSDIEGYDVCKAIVDYCIENDYDFPDYDIQSANPVAVKNITSYINNFKKHNEGKDE